MARTRTIPPAQSIPALKRRLDIAQGIIHIRDSEIADLKNELKRQKCIHSGEGHQSSALIACLGSYLDDQFQAEKKEMDNKIRVQSMITDMYADANEEMLAEITRLRHAMGSMQAYIHSIHQRLATVEERRVQRNILPELQDAGEETETEPETVYEQIEV